MVSQDNFQVIQSVLQANDIVDIVSEYVSLKARGNNHFGLCPFHEEKTPSFSVNPEKQIFKCFGCGAGGDALKFVQRIMNITFPEALQVLANRGGVKIPDRRSGAHSTGPSKVELYKANLWAAGEYSGILWNSSDGLQAKKYLLDRGLDEETCKRFKVGFAPGSGHHIVSTGGTKGFSPNLLESAGLVKSNNGRFYDYFRNRITFPIFDNLGNVTGFGARTLGEDQPKYLNTAETPIFVKQRNMFGLFQGREEIQKTKQVVVVEGYTDVIAAHQAGISNVVATLGTALTGQHVNMLRRYSDQIIIIFDSDQAGRQATDRALTLFLTMGVDVKLSSVTSGKDPCELITTEGAESFTRTIASAVDALEYKWEQLKERYKLSTNTRQKRAAVDEFMTLIAGCDPYGRIDAIQKGMFLSRLAVMLNVPAGQLHSQLKKYRRSNVSRRAGEGAAAAGMIAMPIPQTPLQAAIKDILEVLVCEPGYITGVMEIISPEDCEPEIFTQIAVALWKSYERLGESFEISELLASVEDTGLADVITQLYREGEAKGNFAQTIEGAVRCIQDYRRNQNVDKLEASLSQSLSEEEAEANLMKLYENLKNSGRRIASVSAD